MKVGYDVRYVGLLDKIILYLIFMLALFAGVSRAGLNLSVALLAVAVIVRYIYSPFRIRLEPKLLRAMLIFLCAMTLSTIFSTNIYLSLETLGMFLFRAAIFFCVFPFIKDHKTFEKVICLLAVSLLIGSLIAIWQGMHGSIRAKSFMGIMNFGGAIALIAPILLTYGLSFSKSKYLNPYLLLLTLGLSCIALLYNGTRGALVALVVCAILYLFINGLNKNKIIALSIILIIASMMLTFSNNNFAKRLMYITKPTNDISIIARINMWNYGYEIFQTNPIIGIGLGAFPPYNYNETGNIVPPVIERKPNDHGHIHNNFIQMAAENGIIGLTAFSALFGTILYCMARNFKFERYRLIAIAGFLSTVSFLVHGFFDYTFDIGTEICTFWYLLGLFYAGLNINRTSE